MHGVTLLLQQRAGERACVQEIETERTTFIHLQGGGGLRSEEKKEIKATSNSTTSTTLAILFPFPTPLCRVHSIAQPDLCSSSSSSSSIIIVFPTALNPPLLLHGDEPTSAAPSSAGAPSSQPTMAERGEPKLALTACVFSNHCQQQQGCRWRLFLFFSFFFFFFPILFFSFATTTAAAAARTAVHSRHSPSSTSIASLMSPSP